MPKPVLFALLAIVGSVHLIQSLRTGVYKRPLLPIRRADQPVTFAVYVGTMAVAVVVSLCGIVATLGSVHFSFSVHY